jgi:predicted unusual protein kinase regulating ubiquinone biosynthesis (AarF/ABC1/UbiB family)
LEGTAGQLSPEFRLTEVFRPYYGKMARRRLSVRRSLGRLQQAYRDWERLLESLPRDLGDVLKRLRDGSLSVHFDLRHIDPVINRLVFGVITAALEKSNPGHAIRPMLRVEPAGRFRSGSSSCKPVHCWIDQIHRRGNPR